MSAALGLAQAMRQVETRPTVNVDVACVVLGISTFVAYREIKEGHFPVPTITIGRRIVVPTAPLRKALCLDEAAS